MRIQHSFPIPYPSGKSRKLEAVPSVEPVRPAARQQSFQSGFEGFTRNERILKDAPQDLRVRLALQAYQSDPHAGEEGAALWYAVDIYV